MSWPLISDGIQMLMTPMLEISIPLRDYLINIAHHTYKRNPEKAPILIHRRFFIHT